LASLLSTIESKIEEQICAMRKSDGYNYNWMSVNVPDQSRQDFPSAEIMVSPEGYIENLDDESPAHMDAYSQRVVWLIRVRAELENISLDSEPSYEINERLNEALDDLLLLWGGGGGLQAVQDIGVTDMQFQRAKRVFTENGDIVRPKYLDTYWRCKYMQDRTNLGLFASPA